MRRLTLLLVAACLLGLCPPLPAGEEPAEEYLIGGPLAGVRLPLFRTQHGEPAGHPGCIPELARKAAAEDAEAANEPLRAPFTPVGQNPEHELYPGSVEHWRAYMFKYMPVRSSFDRQSQLKNWVAPDIPGATKAQAERYAAPIWWVPRWGTHKPTGYKMKPVPVVRWGAASKPFTLDCGSLERGVYCVRVIAAVEPAKIRYFRRPLLIGMTVNDGLKGETTEYVKRAGYTDEFYSLCELFFHAPARRRYQVELRVGRGSEVELLVHNVSLDDALAGTLRRPLKTRMTLHSPDELPAVPPEKPRFPDMTAGERLRRDAWLWQSFPPPNSQGNRPYRLPKQVRQGTPTMSSKEIETAHGAWRHNVFRRTFNKTPIDPTLWLTNDKLHLTYSLDDRDNHRPLPDPYPFKDFGCGLTFPDPMDPKAGAYWTPIGNAVRHFYWNYPTALHASVEQWLKTGDESYAHDAAIALARWAYAFPTLHSQSSYLHNLIAEFGDVGRNARFRRRMTTSQFYRWYTQYANEIVDDYDLLFRYLKSHPKIAKSVGRFVPWVKTPDDLIGLIDVYLVQPTAKRILRYQWHTGEMKIARLATLVGDTRVTDPWMEWLFTRTFVYPLPVSGLPDLMVTGCTREGTEYVASTFYAGGENALPKAAALQTYLKAGGSPRFDLSNAARYPKPVAACTWLIERLVAGLHDLRIGDVCGPEKHYGRSFKGLDDASYWGWRWTQDPRFAFLRKHYFGKRDFAADEWDAIEAAAAKVQRAPWLDLPSRALPQWAAILESGRQHDDPRFRRALMLRTGMGWGHHHHDGLDLQVYAHGIMATCDGGQRPTYSRPPDRSTRMHNLVEVDGLGPGGGEWLGHSWTRSLSDAEGARYVLCQAVPPKDHPHVKLYQRQTALIDVDEGEGSQRLTPDLCVPNAKLPSDAVTANSYLFDVVRVRGGKRHTYCFHANLSDQVTHNIANPVPIEQAPAKDQAYVSRMAGERLAGDAPEHLQVTWRIEPRQVKGGLGPNFRPAGPRYFTRLHVVGEKGARVLRGSLDCMHVRYQIPMAFVQRRSPEEDQPEAVGKLESAFAAVIEPYVGQPFITSIERLAVERNDTDASQAVALRVTTANGHTDLCFADGRPDKTRTVGNVSVAGEFAYLSTDAKGLRQATLTGGTLLRSPELLLRTARREYFGTVTHVDYGQKLLYVDSAWPEITGRPILFEVGKGTHWTAYTARGIHRHTPAKWPEPVVPRTLIALQRGADYYLSRVKGIDAKTNTVVCALGFASGPGGGTPTPGMDKHWVASNEDATKFWRAEYLGGNIGLGRYRFKLTGQPAKLSDFGRTKGFRLWEYGVGDDVRHSTSVSLRRVEPGLYVLEADVDVTLALRAKRLSVSADRKAWRQLQAKTQDGLMQAAIPLKALAPKGRLYVRVD